MGSGEAVAREFLSENYKKDLSFDETVKLALKALKEAGEDELSADTLRVAVIKTEDKQFKLLSKDENKKYLDML